MNYILTFNDYLSEKYYLGNTFAASSRQHELALDKAMVMDADGASADEIHSATDWFKGKYDGKWRVEVEDNIDISNFPFTPYYDVLLKKNLQEGCSYVKYIIKNEAFLKLYPEIAELEVQLIYGDGVDVEAEYTPSKKLIFVQHYDLNQIAPYISHEIQHAIQTAEEFARGGSPDDYTRDAKGKLRKRTDAHADYMRVAGEIEARDVQARFNYSQSQRKHNKPFGSEDIPAEKAILRYDD